MIRSLPPRFPREGSLSFHIINSVMYLPITNCFIWNVTFVSYQNCSPSPFLAYYWEARGVARTLVARAKDLTLAPPSCLAQNLTTFFGFSVANRSISAALSCTGEFDGVFICFFTLLLLYRIAFQSISFGIQSSLFLLLFVFLLVVSVRLRNWELIHCTYADSKKRS